MNYLLLKTAYSMQLCRIASKLRSATASYIQNILVLNLTNFLFYVFVVIEKLYNKWAGDNLKDIIISWS